MISCLLATNLASAALPVMREHVSLASRNDIKLSVAGAGGALERPRGGNGGFLVPAGLASPGSCCVGLTPRTLRGGHCPQWVPGRESHWTKPCVWLPGQLQG